MSPSSSVKASSINFKELQKSLCQVEERILAEQSSSSSDCGSGSGGGGGNSKRKKFEPPRQVLQFIVRMGSFTSMTKVIPSADAEDKDVDYPTHEQDISTFLQRCTEQLSLLPPPIERSWTNFSSFSSSSSLETNPSTSGEPSINLVDGIDGERLRVFQWNVLSQTLGTTHDNFVKCPSSALTWRTRRYRMLEEIGRHNPDIICLQEVDHFTFLKKYLASLGYTGDFFPKPDSPCLYLPNNSGPDGCAIFYRQDQYDFISLKKRIIEVWHVQSNQVALMLTLKSKKTGKLISIVTTHLKARSGALLPLLREEQGKDLLEFITDNNPENHPVILTGDFNAEPVEPVYKTLTSDNDLTLVSAYKDVYKQEPAYTTWKIREDGEHKQTLDYIFHTSSSTTAASDDDSTSPSNSSLEVEGVLNMPTEESIGEGRIPSLAYASDHFSLVADFRWKK